MRKEERMHELANKVRWRKAAQMQERQQKQEQLERIRRSEVGTFRSILQKSREYMQMKRREV
jgi:hypothetical protein